MTYAYDPFLTIAGGLRALDLGKITSSQLVEQLFVRADQLDPSLGVHLTRFDDSALEAARHADSLRAAGQRGGPLLGIPLAVKDVLSRLFDEAADHLTDAGADLLEVDLPNYEVLLDVHQIISRSEAFAYHAPWLRERWHDYGPATRRALALGAMLTAGDYVTAQNVRPKLLADVYRVFDGLNAVVMPTVTFAAPRIDNATSIVQSMKNSLTELWNLSGQPVVAAPMGFTASGLPLSIQVIGHAYEEHTVLNITHALQSRTQYHRLRPPLPSSESPPAEGDVLG
jgi:Asp-tRNA(Asn)/Glu-tRNA(Gln) amidotransferase A subunit family amidase